MSQHCAIPINYFKVVNVMGGPLHFKISEVDVDDIAIGNFDSFSLMNIVGVG